MQLPSLERGGPEKAKTLPIHTQLQQLHWRLGKVQGAVRYTLVGADLEVLVRCTRVTRFYFELPSMQILS